MVIEPWWLCWDFSPAVWFFFTWQFLHHFCIFAAELCCKLLRKLSTSFAGSCSIILNCFSWNVRSAMCWFSCSKSSAVKLHLIFSSFFLFVCIFLYSLWKATIPRWMAFTFFLAQYPLQWACITVAAWSRSPSNLSIIHLISTDWFSTWNEYRNCFRPGYLLATDSAILGDSRNVPNTSKAWRGSEEVVILWTSSSM